MSSIPWALGTADHTSSKSIAMQLASMLSSAQASTTGSERVLIGRGLPSIPKRLLEKILRWEYVDLIELLPQSSFYDAASTQGEPQRYGLLPGFEIIKQRKRLIDSITQWLCIVYVAALATRHQEAVPGLLAYMLTILRASDNYDGHHWRAYDTHYRINAAASGNREWLTLDTDLCTRFFTGRAKLAAACTSCDSTTHKADKCPFGRPRPTRRETAG